MSLAIATASGNHSTSTRTEYVLTSSDSAYLESRARVAAGRPATLADPIDPPASLTGVDTFLNGALWAVDSNGILPAASPVPGNVVSGGDFVMPPYSHGFLRFDNGGGSGLRAC